MKKIYFAILLCFLSVSCAVVPSIVIVGITATGIMDIVESGKDAIGPPEFVFPQNTEDDRCAGIGADIKVYIHSDNGEWRPNAKYRYVIDKIIPNGSAELAGLREGGVLYNINGRFTENMSPHEALSYLIGGGEETVSLHIIDKETGLLKKFNVIKKSN